MADRCEVRGCLYYAESGKTLCIQHRAARIASPAENEGFVWVTLKDLPTSARYNEAAGKLYAAMKIAQTGQVLKVSMKKFTKITLTTAKRYALENNLRVGVRIAGDWGYLWRLSDADIKRIEEKAKRLVDARAKRKLTLAKRA